MTSSAPNHRQIAGIAVLGVCGLLVAIGIARSVASMVFGGGLPGNGGGTELEGSLAWAEPLLARAPDTSGDLVLIAPWDDLAEAAQQHGVPTDVFTYAVAAEIAGGIAGYWSAPDDWRPDASDLRAMGIDPSQPMMAPNSSSADNPMVFGAEGNDAHERFATWMADTTCRTPCAAEERDAPGASGGKAFTVGGRGTSMRDGGSLLVFGWSEVVDERLAMYHEELDQGTWADRPAMATFLAQPLPLLWLELEAASRNEASDGVSWFGFGAGFQGEQLVAAGALGFSDSQHRMLRAFVDGRPSDRLWEVAPGNVDALGAARLDFERVLEVFRPVESQRERFLAEWQRLWDIDLLGLIGDLEGSVGAVVLSRTIVDEYGEDPWAGECDPEILEGWWRRGLVIFATLDDESLARSTANALADDNPRHVQREQGAIVIDTGEGFALALHDGHVWLGHRDHLMAIIRGIDGHLRDTDAELLDRLDRSAAASVAFDADASLDRLSACPGREIDNPAGDGDRIGSVTVQVDGGLLLGTLVVPADRTMPVWLAPLED